MQSLLLTPKEWNFTLLFRRLQNMWWPDGIERLNWWIFFIRLQTPIIFDFVYLIDCLLILLILISNFWGQLCESTSYGKAVDIWSVGCIFAELISHKPFFRGENPRHQLEIIINKLGAKIIYSKNKNWGVDNKLLLVVVGCPSIAKQSFISSSTALNILSKLRHIEKPPFSSFFPKETNPEGEQKKRPWLSILYHFSIFARRVKYF